jgi:hypothetical protein
MEIEVPELLRRQEAGSGHRFSCHASRLAARARGAAACPAVVSNAAALATALHRLDPSRVALIAPFHRATRSCCPPARRCRRWT